MNKELTLDEINKYLMNTYKTDRIKVSENDDADFEYFEYMILIDGVCVDEINDLDTYNVNNSIYYYLTGEGEINDENKVIKIVKKELKKWIKI